MTILGTAIREGGRLEFLTESLGRSGLKRFLGCVILSNMPDTGVDEAVSQLWEAYEFHSETLSLGTPKVEAAHPSVGRIGPKLPPPEIVLGT